MPLDNCLVRAVGFPRLFGLPSTFKPARASITTSACFTLLTSPCLAACDYLLHINPSQTTVPFAARRATARSLPHYLLPSLTAHASSSIKTSLIRPSQCQTCIKPTRSSGLTNRVIASFSALYPAHTLCCFVTTALPRHDNEQKNLAHAHNPLLCSRAVTHLPAGILTSRVLVVVASVRNLTRPSRGGDTTLSRHHSNLALPSATPLQTCLTVV
jgi:hypothetical protein